MFNEMKQVIIIIITCIVNWMLSIVYRLVDFVN